MFKKSILEASGRLKPIKMLLLQITEKKTTQYWKSKPIKQLNKQTLFKEKHNFFQSFLFSL